MLKVQGESDAMQEQFWMNAIEGRDKQANKQPPPQQNHLLRLTTVPACDCAVCSTQS